jgi:hypothetical protein
MVNKAVLSINGKETKFDVNKILSKEYNKITLHSKKIVCGINKITLRKKISLAQCRTFIRSHL